MSARSRALRAARISAEDWRPSGHLLAYMTLAHAAENFARAVARDRDEIFALRINRPTDDRVFVDVERDGVLIARYHMRRTRAIMFGTRHERRALIRAVKTYPHEAAQSLAVAIARERFKHALIDLRILDLIADAATRAGGFGHV
jgi:hypothetical protein